MLPLDGVAAFILSLHMVFSSGSASYFSFQRLGVQHLVYLVKSP